MTLNSRFPPPQLSLYSSMVENVDSVNRATETFDLSHTEQFFDSSSRPIEVVDTSKAPLVPSSVSLYSCVDTGSASIRYARPTTNHVPAWPSLEYAAGVPLGCVFQPFCEPQESDSAIPVIETRESVFRCVNCGGFVNAYFSWQDEGSRVECNLCAREFDVPSHYYSPLTATGSRLDKFDKPEVCLGSVDYCGVEALVSPPCEVFVIEASYYSEDSARFVNNVLLGLKHQLLAMVQDTALIIFTHTSVHLIRFSVKEGKGKFCLISMPDVADPFIPDLPANFIFTPATVTDPLSEFLDHLVTRTLVGSIEERAHCPSHACVLAAVTVGMELIRSRAGGGSISVMLFSDVGGPPISDEYTNACLKERIAVDIFVMGMRLDKIDRAQKNVNVVDAKRNKISLVSSMSALSYRTGGEIHCLAENSLESVSRCIASFIATPFYYNCQIRLRASRGLRIEAIDLSNQGASSSSSSTQPWMAVPRMSCDTKIVTKLSIAEQVEAGKWLFLQLACIYSRSDGYRCIRTHTVRLVASATIGSIFKFADAEAMALVIGSEVLGRVSIGRERNEKRAKIMTDSLIRILHAYKTNCALNSGSNGQLILPESLKRLPLMIKGICNLFLRNGGDDCNVLSFLQGSVQRSVLSISPRMFEVNIEELENTALGKGHYEKVIRRLPASRRFMKPFALYLFENADGILFYVGSEVPLRVIENLFGNEIASLGANPDTSSLLHVELVNPTHIVTQFVNGLLRYRDIPRHKIGVSLLYSDRKLEETKFASKFLVEDGVNGKDSSYAEWLCEIHNSIQERINY